MEETDGVSELVNDGSSEQTSVAERDWLLTTVDHAHVRVAPASQNKS